MEISQLSFVLLIIYSLLFGVLLGIVYDVIRIQRVFLGVEYKTKRQRTNYRDINLPIINRKAYFNHRKSSKGLLNIYIAIGDIFFVTLCGIITVLVAYAYNGGRIRAVIWIGLLVGAVLYYFTVGKMVMRLAEFVAFVLRCAVLYTWELVSFPIRVSIKYIRKKKQNKKKGAKNDEFEQPNCV